MILIVWLPLIMVTFCSCGEADSEKEWGSARIYMPQATYGDNKYIVPNDGTATVKISSGDAGQSGYTHLPEDVFTLPESVSVTAGNREKTFYLSVDLNFLRNNKGTNYSLAVSLSEPTNYELNPDISTSFVLINTTLLLEKIDKSE